jgi:hypothetical protein
MKYSLAIDSLYSSRVSVRNTGTLIILIAYTVYYVLLISRGHGVPYVLDNNETYSALLHAHNLWNFDFFRSFGLADDVASPLQAAHPVIHTHQGDFPRLFAFILYAFGARTAESQIWITTFTVGIASLLLAKTFFTRVAGDLFATIIVLILMTDYLLFAQWQVNIYRVWHGFFLFASLVCAHGLGDWSRRKWIIATVCLYACLLYWELIFASFVAVTAGAYTAWIYRRTPRLILIAAFTQSIGAAIGLGILITQVALYLGWQDFFVDLKSTYGARNFGDDPLVAIEKLREFYDSRNITFWYNIQSDVNFRGLMPFLQSIFANVLQIQTPFYVLVTLSLAASAFVADARLPNAQDTLVADPRVSANSTVLLTAGLFFFLVTVLFSSGASGPYSAISFESPDRQLLVILLLLVVSAALAIGLRNLAGAVAVTGTPPGPGRCLAASVYFICLATFIVFQGLLYDRALQQMWLYLLAPVPTWITNLTICVAAFVGGLLILVGRRSLLERWHSAPTSLIPFFVSGAVGYLFAYEFNPGYLRSGYLMRLCPLPVFHIDALLGVGVSIAICMALVLVRRLKNSGVTSAIGAATALFGGLLAALVGFWVVVQYRYMELVPPDQFSFAKSLETTTYKQGIISNTYAAPFGLIANTWAYMNADFGEHSIGPGKDKQKTEYLWFADRASNRAYKTPGFFVCFEPLATYSRLADLINSPSDTTLDCSKKYLTAQSSNLDKNAAAYLDLIRRDEKHALWAIYKVHWNNPYVPELH